MDKISDNKTKKNYNKQNKKLLWDVFDENIKDNSSKIECIYKSPNIQNEYNDNICNLCQSVLKVSDDNFLTCTNNKCGIIQTEILDSGAEWRYYGADDNNNINPTRCGMPINPLLRESSFGCKVMLDYNCKYEMKKIKRYTEWQAMPYKEKALYDEFQRITAMANNSGIPKIIINDAMKYHKIVSEQKTFRGINRDGIIAASIYISCRVNNNPRTSKEIAAIFNLDSTSSTKGCKNAVIILNTLESTYNDENKTLLCKTKPESFINRYCSKLRMNAELTKVCLFVSIKIYSNNIIPENTPHAIAAGIIFLIATLCNLNITKSDIYKITNISEVTINKCYKKLKEHNKDIIPPSIIQKYSN